MRIYVGYESALFFWRHHYPTEFGQGDQAFLHGKTLSYCAHTSEEIAPIKLSTYDFGTDKPTICVPDASYRCLPAEYDYHVCGIPLPSKSYIRVSHNVYVATPELCFLQLAKTHSLVDLLALGFELCGTYPTNPTFENGYECNHGPVTSAKKIAAYLEKTPHHDGVKNARRTARWILDKSASHMETAQAILLTTPSSFGGYAFPHPELNGTIALPQVMHNLTGRQSYRCDMLYRQERVGIEYNSKQEHTGVQRISDDAFRSNALTSLGIRLIVITPRELFDAGRFDTVAREIAKACNWRFRTPSPKQMEQKLNLRNELFRKGGVVMS